MTVTPLNRISQNLNQDLRESMDSVDRDRRSICDSDKQNQEFMLNRGFGDREFRNRKSCMEAVETDQESGGSSTEEMESPKSVARFFARKKSGRVVHNQVLRVKEEEMLLGEAIGEGCLIIKDRKTDLYYPQERHVNVVVFARPILPCSPLSGKSTAATGVKTAPMH